MLPDFHQFLESIIDPKRNPKRRPFERMSQSVPGDDDYDPRAHDELSDLDDAEDDDFPSTSSLGRTAEYPLAHASGKMRGFQTKTPRELFRKPDAVSDKLRGRELFDTLRNKLRAGERMTGRELDILIKLLNREQEQLKG